MRKFLTTSFGAAAICLLAASAWAASGSGTLQQNFTPRVQLVQYGGGGYEHPHHYCRPYWHWACHYNECRCYRD